MENKELRRPSLKKRGMSSESALLFGIKDADKTERFEAALSEVLSTSDNIKEGIEKMVRAALSIEFGEEMLKKKGAQAMVSSISAGIFSDSELRRQSLIIMDMFARSEELNA